VEQQHMTDTAPITPQLLAEYDLFVELLEGLRRHPSGWLASQFSTPEGERLLAQAEERLLDRVRPHLTREMLERLRAITVDSVDASDQLADALRRYGDLLPARAKRRRAWAQDRVEFYTEAARLERELLAKYDRMLSRDHDQETQASPG
jgi:hypothetical protein